VKTPPRALTRPVATACLERCVVVVVVVTAIAVAAVVIVVVVVALVVSPASFPPSSSSPPVMKENHFLRRLLFFFSSSFPFFTTAQYVIVVDHDLSVLDYVSDNICCMFGEAGAFGCVSKPYGVGQGINNFLAGYLPAENVRFRSEPLKFRNAQGLSDSITAEAATHDSKSRSSAGAGGTDGKKTKTKSKGLIDYPDGRIELLEKTKKKKKKVKKEKATTAAAKPTAAKPTAAKTTTSTAGENKTKTPAPKVAFTLNIEAGAYRSGEIVGLLGENGCGKSTFMKHLSEKIGTSVSYKLQHFGPKLKKFEGTVEELLEAHINTALSNRFFRLHVLTPLDIKMLGKTPVKALSGGQVRLFRLHVNAPLTKKLSSF